MFFFISIFQAGCSKSSDSGKPEIKEMHFLTDGELYDSMYKKIKAAKNNIWIAALIFNAPDKSDNLTKKLLDLLIEKHQSGIMINVVLDSSKGGGLRVANQRTYKKLKDIGVNVVFSDEDIYLHNKILVSDDYVFIGSHNLADSSFVSHHDATLLIQSKELAHEVVNYIKSLPIKGNIVLSLGMVGALSIVRFRTPIKDPVDLVFIFWAITIGIANGVGHFSISIIGSALISLVIIFMAYKDEESMPYLLILQLDKLIDDAPVLEDIQRATEKFRLKSKSVNPEYNEIIAEVRLRKDNTDFMTEITNNYKVKKINILTYSSDLASV